MSSYGYKDSEFFPRIIKDHQRYEMYNFPENQFLTMNVMKKKSSFFCDEFPTLLALCAVKQSFDGMVDDGTDFNEGDSLSYFTNVFISDLFFFNTLL